MDFERLEQVWNSHANDPPSAAVAYLTEEIMDDLKKRRRQIAGLLAIGAVALAAQTALVVAAAVDDRVMDLGREWGTLLPFGLAWVVLLVVLRQHRRHLGRHPDPHLSMPATLAALIDFNRGEMARIRIIAVAFAALAAALVVAVGQLEGVGKMTAGNVRDMGILFGVLVASLGAYGAWRYFGVLRPEHDRLVRLRDEYAHAARPG